LAEGDDERYAQSRGLWPGVSRTLRRGLVGMELCVGGGVRDEVGGPRFGSGGRMGGDKCPPAADGMG
jgi:hypothetical protein